MASTYTSTKETTNYARLCRLLVDVGTQVLRDKFDKMYAGSLYTFLTSPPVHAKLTSLQKKRVLNFTQLAKLTSSTVSSADFDISLLVVLLRNVCGLSPPATTGWNNPPLPTDMTEEADIVRIRILRNEVYAHTNVASVDDLTFSKYWVSIKEPLIRLGGSRYQSTVDDLRTECMDPEKEQHYQELLKEWKENEECVMETLGSIKETLDANGNKLQMMDEKLDTLVQSVAHPVEDVNVEGQNKN